jgi:hypothetical protein
MCNKTNLKLLINTQNLRALQNTILYISHRHHVSLTQFQTLNAMVQSQASTNRILNLGSAQLPLFYILQKKKKKNIHFFPKIFHHAKYQELVFRGANDLPNAFSRMSCYHYWRNLRRYYRTSEQEKKDFLQQACVVYKIIKVA